MPLQNDNTDYENPGGGEDQVAFRPRIRMPRVQQSRGDLPPSPDEFAAQAAQMQGGAGPRQKHAGPGELTGVQVGPDGQEYIRDGAWFVRKDVVDANGGDIDSMDPRIVEANRIPYQRFVTQKAAAARPNAARWRATSQVANPSGANAFTGMQGYKLAQQLGVNVNAIDPGEQAQGGDADLAWYILNGHISVVQKPDGSWGLINTGQDPNNPNSQWFDPQTGATTTGPAPGTARPATQAGGQQLPPPPAAGTNRPAPAGPIFSQQQPVVATRPKPLPVQQTNRPVPVQPTKPLALPAPPMPDTTKAMKALEPPSNLSFPNAAKVPKLSGLF